MRTPAIVFFALVSLSVGHTQQVRYYRHFDMDGRYQYRGLYEVSPVDAYAEWVFAFQYDSEGMLQRVQYLRKGRPFFHPRLGAAQVLIRREGNFEIREFRNARGLSTSTPQGISSLRLRYNEQGHPTNLYHYDQNGFLSPDRNGVSAYAWVLDEKGRRVRSLRFDRMGNRIADRQDRWELEYEWDRQDRLVRVLYKDRQGRLQSVDGVVSGLVLHYGPHGERLSLTRLGEDGQPIAAANGIMRTQWKYDEQGRQIERAYSDELGHPVADRRGIAVYRWDYNDTENFVREWYFDSQGERTLDWDGVAMRKDIWFAQDNERALMNYGWAINPRWESLPHLAREKEERFLLTTDANGIAVYRWAYDDDLNVLEEKFFDDGLQPTSDAKGIAIYRRRFSPNGLILEERFYSTWNQPTVRNDGVHAMVWEYNTRNQLTRQSNLDAYDRLKEDAQGVASTLFEYDTRGLQVQKTILGVWDQIKEDQRGVAIYAYRYDRFGQVIEQAHFSIDSRPTEDIDGVHLYRWQILPAGRRELIGRYQRPAAQPLPLSLVP